MLRAAPSDDRPVAANSKVTDFEDSEKDHVRVKEGVVVDRLNQLFGFNGWSSEIRDIKIDFADIDPNTKEISLGVSAIIRVTLSTGTFHDALGYGSATGHCDRGKAFRDARKMAVSDGLQDALQRFGASVKQCTSDDGSNRDGSKVSTQLRSSASLEMEGSGRKRNTSVVLLQDSVDYEFGSDPFEESEQ